MAPKVEKVDEIMKISKAVFLQSIRDCEGKISTIAAMHGMTYYGVQKRIKSDPELADALEDTREHILDLAESQLIQAVRKGEMWAVKYLLETRGKSRGYSKRVDVVRPEQQGRVVVYSRKPPDADTGSGAVLTSPPTVQKSIH